MTRVWWTGCFGVLALVGCRADEQDQAYQPPTFPPPVPREMRLDEPTGAILSKPAPEWAWVEGEALRGLAPDAVLGLRRDERCEGWVAVTPKVESSPRAPARRVLESRLAAAQWDKHVDEDVLYANHTARRWEIQRRDGDTVVSERTSFLIEGPRLFAVHARARDTDYGRRRRCLDAFTAAFDVMMWMPPEGAAETKEGAEAPPADP